MIKSLFRRNLDFIEIYDHALSKKECEILINQFEKSNPQRGVTSGGYEPGAKDCLELHCNLEEECVITNILRPKLISYMGKYVKKHRFHEDKGALDLINTWGCCKWFNIQKYDGENDGYKKWHTEQGPSNSSSKRILAWMFYLNDAKCGTEFAYFPTINSKAGRCVIWPSSWTHLHRGVIPNKGIKYIVTGWFSYDSYD